jgi:hypothetical protein
MAAFATASVLSLSPSSLSRTSKNHAWVRACCSERGTLHQSNLLGHRESALHNGPLDCSIQRCRCSEVVIYLKALMCATYDTNVCAMHVIADAKLNIRSSILQIEKYVLPPFTKECTCGISKTNYYDFDFREMRNK